jgi:methionyl-tRNA synthetase
MGKYEGWYCVSDESFLAPSQVKDSVDAEGVFSLSLSLL